MAENKVNHTADSSNSNDVKTQEELNKLDAVRDLLFGQNVQEYRNEIKELKQEIEKSEKNLSDRVSNSDKDFSKRLDELSQKIDAHFNKIEGQLDLLSKDKVDKSTIADALSSLAKSIQSK